MAAVNRLLLIHPDAVARVRLAALAEQMGLTVDQACSVSNALETVDGSGPFGVIVLTTAIGGNDRVAATDDDIVDAVRVLSRRTGRAEIIVLTEHSLSMDTCCDLVQLGVSGFVDGRHGHVDHDLLSERLSQAKQRFEQAQAGTAELHAIGPAERNSLVWQSPAMADVLSRAARAAQVSDVPVLIYGESGTGKQLLAELIHRLDPKRSKNRFLSVNCSAISGTLAESTLFGHVKGAFTGATGSRKGIFLAADGGTVLLDEIGEMDLALQPKLLRVLQAGVVMPLGSDVEIEKDVRIIGATNKRLAALVEEGKFRLDLYQRLNVITLEIPPLRERPEDIPALVQFFLKKYGSYYERPITSVDPRVYEFLASCTLQGNVRELENTVRQILAFKSSGTELVLGDIPPSILARTRKNRAPDRHYAISEFVEAACRLVDCGKMTLPQLVSTCERLVLRNSLEKSTSTSADLAKQLGMSRRTLYNKIQKYRLFEPGSLDSQRSPKP
jgi:DNA-binding NtrC family response regulator